jgi:hypothetical protein
MLVHIDRFSALSRIKDITGSDAAIKEDTSKMYKVRGPLQLYVIEKAEEITESKLEAFLFIEEGEYIRIYTDDFPHIFTNKNALYIKVCDAADKEIDRFLLGDSPHIVNPKDDGFNDIEKIFVEQYEIFNIKAGNSYVVSHK